MEQAKKQRKPTQYLSPCVDGFSATPTHSTFRAPNIADGQFISAQSPAWARF